MWRPVSMIAGAVMVGLTVPASASPLDTFITKYDTTYKTEDAKTLSQYYAPDAVVVTADGTVHNGRAAIEEAFRNLFKAFGPLSSLDLAPDHQWQAGDHIVAIGHFAADTAHIGHTTSHWMAYYTKSGDGLQIQALTIGANVPAPKRTTGK